MCVQAGTSATQPVVNLAQLTRQDLLRVLFNYNTLLNCSNSIKEACTMPTHIFNATKKALLDNCAYIFNKSKTASDGKPFDLLIPNHRIF